MQMLSKGILIVSVLFCFLFTGCSNTSVTGIWKKSDYNAPPFTSILVVGLTGDPGNKFSWENKMATSLREAGVKNVLTTFNAFPNDDNIDEKEIIDYVTKNNIEAVLVTRLVDTKKETIYQPPPGGLYSGAWSYYRNFNSYYSHAYARAYTTTRTVYILETNLYEVTTQELVWSMSSDTVDSDYIQSVRQIADSASNKVRATLQKEKLI